LQAGPASFEDYPPRQASMDVDTDETMEDMMNPNAR
jgi:hypothetical protein